MYKLYGRPGSGSLAVQVALEEMGAPYERIWVGREAADVARFRAINPTGRVPALSLPDGTLMFESAAMLIHLAPAHPESAAAAPSGTSRHATFLQWMVFLSANVYEAALRMYYSERYSSRGAADAEAIRQKGTADFRDHLALISQGLPVCDGIRLFGRRCVPVHARQLVSGREIGVVFPGTQACGARETRGGTPGGGEGRGRPRAIAIQ